LLTTRSSSLKKTCSENYHNDNNNDHQQQRQVDKIVKRRLDEVRQELDCRINNLNSNCEAVILRKTAPNILSDFSTRCWWKKWRSKAT
jgi:hypothetical protein